ncbi:MAG: hypothetical protein ACE5F6_10790, partial [Anaerolineae bacterium]
PRRPDLPAECPQPPQQQAAHQWYVPGVGQMLPLDRPASAMGRPPHPPPWPAPACASQHHHLGGQVSQPA